MSPFLHDRYSMYRYAAACVAIAAAYSAATGWLAGLPFDASTADAALSSILFAVEGILLWYIARYGNDINPLIKIVQNAVWAIFAAASIIVVEKAALYAIFDEEVSMFPSSTAARALIIVLLFVILNNYYIKSIEEEKDEKEEKDELDAILPQPETEKIDRITIRSGQKIVVIEIDDIIMLQAEGDYVRIVSKDGQWIKEQTMKYYEEHLPHDRFIRVHRSHIVNIGKISRIERYGQQQQVSLCNGDCIKVSAGGYKLLKERMDL